MNTEALESFLDNKCFIFHSPCGKKGVELSTAQRLRNRITDVNQLKDFQNYNLFTGYSNVADIDLDCPEVLELADYFLIPAGIEFGRESTPRSHRLYKILDMDKKKHTRSSLTFRDSDKDNTLIELRAHNHYTMCGGLYDNKEKVVYNKLETSLPSSVYKEAEAKDEVVWRESVRKRIEGRSNAPDKPSETSTQ